MNKYIYVWSSYILRRPQNLGKMTQLFWTYLVTSINLRYIFPMFVAFSEYIYYEPCEYFFSFDSPLLIKESKNTILRTKQLMVNSSIPLYFLCFFYFSAQKCNIFWNTVLYDWVTKFLGTLCLSQTFDSFRCLSIPFWYFFGTCLSFWVAIRVILDTEASKW